MMQGDSYGISIEILNSSNTVVTDADVSDVEITIGFLTKKHSTGEVYFDSKNNKWVFPITQEESFKFPSATVKGQVRVVWPSGGVEGASLGFIEIFESMSKEVL